MKPSPNCQQLGIDTSQPAIVLLGIGRSAETKQKSTISR